MSSGLLSLKWNNHRTTFFHVLSTIRSKDSYSDVTLACEGRFYSLHKFVLATCSEYFEQIFQKTQCKHPVIVLKDISFEDLEALLNYMYIGEVNVVQEKLSSLIKAAECLRIKGLAVPDEEEAASTKENTTNSQQLHSQKRSQKSEGSPQAKRRRRNASSDGPTKDASDHERSFDSSKFKTSNQQYNSSYKRHSNLIDNDRSLSQENSNELSTSSPSSIISSRISRDSNECRDTVEQVDQLSDVKTEPLESEVVSVSPEIPLTADTKEGILDGLMEGNDGHAMDGSLEDLHGQPVEEALWKAEGSCSYDAVEDASAASVACLPSFYNSLETSTPSTSETFSNTVHVGSSHPQGQASGSSCTTFSPGSAPTSFLTSADPSSTPPRRLLHCPLCSYTTNRPAKVEIHLRTHTGERPFACSVCQYRASRKENLKAHMRKHQLHTLRVPC